MAFRGTRPTPEAQNQREDRAWELRSNGWSQARIAAELGITQQAVSLLLKRLAKQFAKEFKKRVEEIKGEQTAQLEFLVDEALQEWERSKSDAEKKSVKSGRCQLDRDGNPVDLDDEVTQTTEGRLADPRYLQQARDGMGDIRKIWGVDAPVKTETEQKVSGEVKVTGAAQDEAAKKLDEWRKQMQEQLTQTRLNSPLAVPMSDISPTTSAE